MKFHKYNLCFSGREQPGLLQYHAGRCAEFATEGERRKEEMKCLNLNVSVVRKFSGIKVLSTFSRSMY